MPIPRPRQSLDQPSESLKQPYAMDCDRSVAELRALDCNLTSLCDHIQSEGFTGGIFSDVVVQALGTTYHLHRIILSRSPYFRNMLQGPWKEAGAPTLKLLIDDDNVSPEAMTMALAYLYGHYPKFSDRNAFRVLAVASFLDLQDLCGICTDFIISELWTSNFLTYQVFAESHDYGIHGERVRSACWGYLCQCACVELREVLPRLSAPTLLALLTSDELWVPNEEKRFELALHTLLKRDSINEAKNVELKQNFDDSASLKGKAPSIKQMESELEGMSIQEVDLSSYSPTNDGSTLSATKPLRQLDKVGNFAFLQTSFPCSRVEAHDCGERSRVSDAMSLMEGPSSTDESHFQLERDSSADWGGSDGLPFEWAERKYCQSHPEGSVKSVPIAQREEYEAFINIFEGGSLLYCHMSFEALLHVRKQLEEWGFPCKTVNDGLWMQMLLSHRVQEIAADTCISCCNTMSQCTCRQAYGFSRGCNFGGYYEQEHTRGNGPQNLRNVYISDAQGERNGLISPARVHVRGPIDGLAGIGRGTSPVHGAAWPSTRVVFSRVPHGVGHRNGHQSLANDESEVRVDSSGNISGDGLTALVGLGHRGALHVHAEQSDAYQTELQESLRTASHVPSTSGVSMQMMEAPEGDLGNGWEDSDVSSVSWDLKTALRHFPPFRFGVEFEDVHRLADGQVKHSPEAFYAGSLWKVSVQAFNNEYPQGRRTIGLFLHRRKAEASETLRKAHMYVDSRDKVTARYQLICPSKREVMVVGSFKDSGTLLPKAPKGWGWRTALLFDELPDLLQGGALRVVAVVQLV
ncbi:BTB/POZ domain-containing protein [Wolffia australiana]